MMAAVFISNLCGSTGLSVAGMNVRVFTVSTASPAHWTPHYPLSQAHFSLGNATNISILLKLATQHPTEQQTGISCPMPPRKPADMFQYCFVLTRTCCTTLVISHHIIVQFCEAVMSLSLDKQLCVSFCQLSTSWIIGMRFRSRLPEPLHTLWHSPGPPQLHFSTLNTNIHWSIGSMVNGPMVTASMGQWSIGQRSKVNGEWFTSTVIQWNSIFAEFSKISPHTSTIYD